MDLDQARLVGSRPPGGGGRGREDRGVEANARLTASTAAVLFVLLAAEGVTILSVHSLLRPHVFVGALLIPPVLLKTATTTWRFARYYLGSPSYRRKGPPPWILRVLGPAVVALTLTVLGTGVALLYAGSSWHGRLLTAHKASFILWFGAMAVHVIGHLPETVRRAGRDWGGRARLAGANLRRGTLVASVGAGLLAGAVLLGKVSAYLASTSAFRFKG